MTNAAFASRADLLTRGDAKRVADWASPTDKVSLPNGTLRAAILGQPLNINDEQQSALDDALLAIDTALIDAHGKVLSYGNFNKTDVLVRIEVTIALFFLAGINATEELTTQYNASLKTLEQIKKGELETAGTTNPTETDNGILIAVESAPNRYAPNDDGEW